MYLQPHAKVDGEGTYRPLPPSMCMKNEGGAGHIGQVDIDKCRDFDSTIGVTKRKKSVT